MGPRIVSGFRIQAAGTLRRLRILQLDAGRTWRGGQRQALLLARGLKQRGHEPLVICPPGAPLLRRARDSGLPVSGVPMSSDWDLLAVRRVRARIRTWQPDLIHAHDARSHAIAMHALAGGRDIPLVVTRRVQLAPRAARMKYGHRVARFIAVSRAVRDALVASGIESSRIAVVHDGIELPSGDLVPVDWRARLGWPDDSVLCGVVGAMTVEKGVGDLAVIAAALPRRSASRARLVLLGGGRIENVQLGGLPVHAAGFVEQVGPAVAGLDVLWHPSRLEALGTALLDAMTVGVPPVAFAVGGIPEIVQNGVSGILVDPGDLVGFAAAAHRLIDDPGLRAALGAAARERALQFDAARMTQSTEAVYYSLVTG